jgi:hypothetical protein
MFTFGFGSFVDAIMIEVTRRATGQLFSDDQIRTISKTAIGKYFANLLPEPADERTARERVEEARLHIVKASTIIADMQGELSQQSVQLDKLLAQVEEKKKLAEQYSQLAATNRQQFAAFRTEMEDALRQELVEQAKKGKRLRQTASSVIWIVTLVLGAWLGTYFKDVWAWVKHLVV